MSDEREGAPAALDGSPGLAESLLRWVERKRLQAPVALLLAMHRPLMPLAWSLAVLFGAILAPFFGADYYKKIEALREPTALDRVLQRLERSAEEDPND